MRFLQWIEVVRAQVLAREFAPRRANAAGRLRDQEAHGRRRSGEVRVREIDANGAGSAADGQAIVDQVGDIAGAAAADNLGAEQATLAALEPGPQGRQALEPLHEQVWVAGKMFAQVINRED